MDYFFQGSEGLIGPGSWRVRVEPAVRQAMGEELSQLGSQRGEISRSGCVAKCCGHFASGREIDQDWLRVLPIGRDLQDCRAAQAAMRDQQFFAELLFFP